METEDPRRAPASRRETTNHFRGNNPALLPGRCQKARESEMSLAEQIDRIATKDGSEGALNYGAVHKIRSFRHGWRYLVALPARKARTVCAAKTGKIIV